MIDTRSYSERLANISPHAPTDLDPALFGKLAKKAPMPVELAPGPAPAGLLWDFTDPTLTFIGLRVTAPIEAPAHLASKLAAAAIERQVIPIFLSHLPNCEMLRYGFRVELVTGADENARAAAETQLKRMWNLALIIDIADADKLS